MSRAGQYAVYSVYYSDDGHMVGFSEEPTYPSGGSPEELAEDFDLYRRALTAAVLNYEASDAELLSPRAVNA